MKKIVLIILVIATVILVGTWPLYILAKLMDWIAYGLRFLAKTLDFFGWNGLLK